MPVITNPSLRIGAQPLPLLPNHFSSNGNIREHYYPTRVSMQLQPLSQGKFPSLCVVSKSKRSLFACNAALDAKCSQGQTQTVARKSPTITQAPNHGKEKSPMLDDGGRGLPPRDDGGGGGGGGGGSPSSGGFFLFGFLLFMGYLKDLEGEHENNR